MLLRVQSGVTCDYLFIVMRTNLFIISAVKFWRELASDNSCKRRSCCNAKAEFHFLSPGGSDAWVLAVKISWPVGFVE